MQKVKIYNVEFFSLKMVQPTQPTAQPAAQPTQPTAQPAQPAAQPAVAQPQPVKKKKKWWIWLIVVGVLIGLGVAAYFIFF